MIIKRIDALFTLEEQIDIVWEAGGIIQKYEESKVPEKKRYYFSDMAQRYQLAPRIKHQLEAYRLGLLKYRELTTNEDIAKLFLVERSTVARYLQSKLETQDFKDRVTLLRSAGGSIGGKIVLLKDTNKKENGRGKRNNKCPRNY